MNGLEKLESDFDLTRRFLADLGYRIMHHRNGQYWVMLDKPLTLAEMQFFAISRGIRKRLDPLVYKKCSNEAAFGIDLSKESAALRRAVDALQAAYKKKAA